MTAILPNGNALSPSRPFRALSAILLLLLLAPALCGAETSPALPVLPQAQDPEYDSHLTRGETISSAVAQLTGISMSPLLGVGLRGAWVYFTTDAGRRGDLAWFYHPWCWGTMLAFVLCMFCKSTIGETVPFLKKPLDAVCEVVNSTSFLLTLPIIAWVFADAAANPTARTLAFLDHTFFAQALADEGIAPGSGAFTSAGWILALLLGALLCFVIWLSWHVIDILILLCPVPAVDALLRTFRLLIIAGLLGLTAINPYAGLIASLLIILISFLIFRWSFRLLLLGWHFAWDLLCTLLGFRSAPTLPLRAFSGKGLSCPRRTCGRLQRNADGLLVFRWRKWLLIPRTAKLPPDCRVQNGLLGASLVEGRIPVALLPPHTRKQAAAVAALLNLPQAADASGGAPASGLQQTLDLVKG